MFGLSDIQYLYEFLFWLIIYLSLKRIWNKEQVRVLYGYSVASLNFVAAIFFMSPLYGNFNIYNAIAFAFLHCLHFCSLGEPKDSSDSYLQPFEHK